MRGPRSLHGLARRQVRTPTLVMAAFALVVVRVGVSSYNASGGALGLAGTVPLLKNPAIVALYGRANNLGSAGAFVAWKMGMFLALGVAMWGGLMATRLTRLGEDEGTVDLLVAGPAGRARQLAAVTRTLAEAGLLVGLAVYVGLATDHQAPADTALYALAFAGVAWSGSALGLLAGQLVAPRRSASQCALGAVGLLFLVRMVADAGAHTHGIAWASPFGWLEDLGAFQRREAGWVAPLLCAPAAMAALAARAQATRDVGAATWTRSDRARAHVASLRTSWRFAWRERRSTILVWGAGLALYCLVMGYLTKSLVDLARTDPGYVALLKRYGLGSLVTVKGFVAETGSLVSVGVGFLVLSLFALLGQDQLRGRLDLALGFGPSRARWFASSYGATIVATAALAVLSGVAVWVGVLAGGAHLSVVEPVKGLVNAAAPAPFVLGLAAVLVAAVPRQAFATLSALLGLSYLVAVLGPALHWPSWTVDLSLFHYVAAVPSSPPDWAAAGVFVAGGALLVALGTAGFARRDITA